MSSSHATTGAMKIASILLFLISFLDWTTACSPIPCPAGQEYVTLEPHDVAVPLNLNESSCLTLPDIFLQCWGCAGCGSVYVSAWEDSSHYTCSTVGQEAFSCDSLVNLAKPGLHGHCGRRPDTTDFDVCYRNQGPLTICRNTTILLDTAVTTTSRARSSVVDTLTVRTVRLACGVPPMAAQEDTDSKGPTFSPLPRDNVAEASDPPELEDFLWTSGASFSKRHDMASMLTMPSWMVLSLLLGSMLAFWLY
mmetsp:Transcript_25766/g.53694  ORF Transcript_25766/g.53694 Transcript_25766/m.53694 type:complete len:251 (-) Transcript_25766:475-1227(-)